MKSTKDKLEEMYNNGTKHVSVAGVLYMLELEEYSNKTSAQKIEDALYKQKLRISKRISNLAAYEYNPTTIRFATEILRSIKEMK